MNIALIVKDIIDTNLRKNFETLKRIFNQIPILDGQFVFFEIEVSGAQSHYRYKHNLAFVPHDVLQTSVIGAGAVTWNYDLFDKDFLDLTTTGDCTVRAFVGTYQQGVSL